MTSTAARPTTSETAQLVASTDWAATPLAPRESWPQSLSIMLGVSLNSRFPYGIFWGPQLIQLYNDAYIPLLGAKHPAAMGQPAEDVWREIWDVVGPMLHDVFVGGDATWFDDLPVMLNRYGYTEETYFTFSYSGIPVEDGSIGGVLTTCLETTQRVVSLRRLATLAHVAEGTTDARSAEDACAKTLDALTVNNSDIPFALIYLFENDSDEARLAGTSGLDAETVGAARLQSPAAANDVWHVGDVRASRQPRLIDGIERALNGQVAGPWPEPPRQAYVLPLTDAANRVFGCVVLGVSARLSWNDDYARFFGLLATQISLGVVAASGRELERARTNALIELDRAKTAFFSNVSHEFRTPLTLLLGPLEEALAADGAVPAEQRELLLVAHRNSERLLRLVNTLLDFSRIEAGRVQALYEPVDLAAYTAELVSMFRSAFERAGVDLNADLQPLREDVYVDREMWEKIVMNLLSNAFKFTFEGSVTVSLRQIDGAAELTIADTGAGVPADEMPRLFERFHRVENAQSRTHEGSGIGLALVHALAKLHGGAVSAKSELGRGTTFTVTIPLGIEHLPAERLRAKRETIAAGASAGPYVQEALRWLPDAEGARTPDLAADPEERRAAPGAPMVLVADDNADMRDYIARLLSSEWKVLTAGDGEEALRLAAEHRPNLVISDIMMPKLDGFGLLRELRNQPATLSIPMILLSARAGEEARIEGLAAGADDYLVKPFGANELMARVRASIALGAARGHGEAQWQALTDGLPGLIVAADASGKLYYFNPRYQEYTGLPNDRLAAEWSTVWHPDDAQHVIDSWTGALRTGGTFMMEARLRRHDGAYRCHVVYGSPVRDRAGQITAWIASALDIDDRKRMEEDLRAQEGRWRALTQSMPALVATTDAHGVVNFHNDRWSEYTGLSPAELREQWSTIVHPDDLLALTATWQETLAAARMMTNEYRIRRRDGAWRWHRSITTPVRDANGALEMWIDACIDIDDQKRIIEELRVANAAKDDFLGMVSHELRTPITTIFGNAEILERRGDRVDEASRRAALADIRNEAERLHRIIDNLLVLARLERGRQLDLEPVLLQRIVERVAADHRRQHPDSAIVIASEAQMLPVLAAPGYVEQVLRNLLSNAQKYGATEGTIEVTVTRESASMVTRVLDRGAGISQEDAERIFTPFFRAASTALQAQGIGIGLAVCKRLIEAQSGEMSYRPRDGGGSEFAFSLPLATDPIED